jgi:hypothetical protein
MLIVLPFCKLDYKLAVSLAKYLQHLGPYKQHELMLVCRPDIKDHLEELEKLIGDQFGRVLTLTPNCADGWPQGSNIMFHMIADYISRSVDCPCWYMFEPDNTPIKPGWANTLQEEYTRAARPFMGVVHATFWKRKDGTFYQDGTHMNGSGIYPKNTPAYSRLFSTIPHTGLPWDVYWQWEIVKYAANTNYMQLDWRSFNFRRDKKSGEIVGDRAPGILPAHLPAPRLRPDAVVHHGCKDGSIMQIMRGFLTARKEEITEEAPAAI